jgi:RNA polymerase sigma-70 factor (ECF subfamily)
MERTSRPTPRSGASAAASTARSPEAQQDAQQVQAWVQAALDGDEGGYAQLFERFRNDLFRLARRYARDSDGAMDLVQQAFVKAFRRLDSYKGGSFAHWLRRILVNVAIDAARRNRRHRLERVALEEGLHDAPEESGALPGGTRETATAERTVVYEEFNEAVMEAVGELSDSHRETFLLHAVEELTYRQIAERMGTNMGTVMSRLHYARQQLKERLRAHWDDDHV